MSDTPCKTPVADLLRAIPEDLVINYETDKDGFKMGHNCPIGRHAHEAAARIQQLQAQLVPAQPAEPLCVKCGHAINEASPGYVDACGAPGHYQCHAPADKQAGEQGLSQKDVDELTEFGIVAPPPPQEAEPAAGQMVEPVAIELRGIAEVLTECDGFWATCTGCHESNEGHPTGPYSSIFKCTLGIGCSECGGIGAVWDDTDYAAMAEALLKEPDELDEPRYTSAPTLPAVAPIAAFVEMLGARMSDDHVRTLFRSCANEIRREFGATPTAHLVAVPRDALRIALDMPCIPGSMSRAPEYFIARDTIRQILDPTKDCPACKGVGERPQEYNETSDPQNATTETLTCPDCNGSGEVALAGGTDGH